MFSLIAKVVGSQRLPVIPTERYPYRLSGLRLGMDLESERRRFLKPIQSKQDGFSSIEQKRFNRIFLLKNEQLVKFFSHHVAKRRLHSGQA